MNSPPTGNASQNLNHFKSFISESELEENRRRRQEEWEKVRNPDQPLDAPEEEYDPRSLYERLQEQRDKKQAEFEEAHRLRNMIKGLDNDEVQFLDLVDKTKEEMEAKRLQEEGKEIEEYRKAVANMAEEAEGQKLLEIKNSANSTSTGLTATASSQRRSQQSLLAGAVKRKSTDKRDTDEKRGKLNDSEVNTGLTEENIGDASKTKVEAASAAEDETSTTNSATSSPGVACVGVLPGLGIYSDSSDSDNSSDSEIEPSSQYDLLGRPRWQGHSHVETHQHSSKA